MSEPSQSGPSRLEEDPGIGQERDDVQRALDQFRREVRARLLERRAPEAGSGLDWEDLFESARRRLSTIGMVERSAEVDEFGMDDVVIAKWNRLFDALADRWWRIDVEGLDPGSPPLPSLFVANASGLLPWDGIMLAHMIARARPDAPRPRFLVADWLVTQPFAQPTLAGIGGVRACRENAERLLRSGRSVVSFPEGLKGSAKVFRERYRLRRFGRGGAVRIALALGVPLVPVAVIGAEETHPVLFKVGSLARLVGLPFLPVTPTFPWLGPLGLVPLPSRWRMRFGAPLDFGPHGPEAADDEILVDRLTVELRSSIQRMIDEAVRTRDSVFA